MLDVIGLRKYFIGISLVLVAASTLALIYPGLKFGVDFTAGSSLTVRFTGEDPGSEKIFDAFSASGHNEAVVQRAGGAEYFVRTTELGETGVDAINAELTAQFGEDYEIVEITTVGSAVARDTIRTALYAVLAGVGFVMVYIMYSFRSVPASYRYAIASVVPLAHDVLITMGAFAVLGKVMHLEVNAIFVVGVLTLIGSSVNNTIVVFDRIRENVRVAPQRPFRQTVNIAISETLTRNLNVTVTLFIALLAMFLLGGQSLQDFLIILLVGMVVGLYSTTFIAAQIIVALESGEMRRMFRLPFRRGQAAAQRG
jgi:preprotein translocase subunit SecF